MYVYRIPPRAEKLFTSVVRVGSDHYIVTNAKDYQIVGPIDPNKSGPQHFSPYKPVKHVLDHYKIPSGGYAVFDKHDVVYGKCTVKTRKSAYCFPKQTVFYRG